MTHKLTVFERSFTSFGKKWMLPGDLNETTFEGREYTLYCQQEAGCGMRIYFARQNKVLKMWTLIDNRKWHDDTKHAFETYAGPHNFDWSEVTLANKLDALEAQAKREGWYDAELISARVAAKMEAADEEKKAKTTTKTINAQLRQHNDKSNLEVVLHLTAEQRELFLLEKGILPAWTIIVKEVA